MNKVKGLMAWEVLAVAIRSEEDAVAFYSGLREKVRNVILLDKLDFLVREEGRHEKILRSIFSQRFRGKPETVPPGAELPGIAAVLPAEAGVLDLFRAALKAEEMSEAFYLDAARLAEDEGSRHILAYLSRAERSHQAMIKAEMELLEIFPDYYSADDFHVGQEMFHIGP